MDWIKYQLIHRQAVSTQISGKEESTFTIATCYDINLNRKYSRKKTFKKMCAYEKTALEEIPIKISVFLLSVKMKFHKDGAYLLNQIR